MKINKYKIQEKICKTYKEIKPLNFDVKITLLQTCTPNVVNRLCIVWTLAKTKFRAGNVF